MTPDHLSGALIMCGVLAWVGLPGSQPRRDQLERMNNRMTHRGPDGSGVDIVGHVGLAHRRFAIIDVHGAKQPMQGPPRGPHQLQWRDLQL